MRNCFLTFILSQTSAKPIATSGNNFDVYRRLAVATHGDLFVIDKDDVPDVMKNVLKTYHKMENLAVRYGFDCNGIKLDVPTEYNSNKKYRVLLTVDKNDNNPAQFDWPYVTDMSFDQLQLVSRGKYYALYEIYPNAMDSIRVVSPTPGLICSIRVFVNSNNAVLLSYTNNRQMDIGSPVMYKNIPQLATALPLGFSGFDNVEIRPFDSRTGNELSVTVQGYKRAGDSTYAYEFDDLSDCTNGPFILDGRIGDANIICARVSILEMQTYCHRRGRQLVQLRFGNAVATRVLPGYCALPGPPIASKTSQMMKTSVSAAGWLNFSPPLT
ncbi:unnamed protein product [Strongylus vulgaris]|uniref:Uncharacterized protein n=1 Tax=Strongylus vulgaris TaxID=40348 RepID=A0A3P7IL95_STRVU|nr:unnamed protein product [Strongylus vulgaris]